MVSSPNSESINMYPPQYLSMKRHYFLVFRPKNNSALRLYILVPKGYKQNP